jgi:parallel beta-helix repeat protein
MDINISTAIAGPVVLDFKGFTITGSTLSNAVTIGFISSSVANTYPITIRNGTIQNGLRGVGAFAVFTNIPLFDIRVNNMVFNDFTYQGSAGVEFENVSSSTISNCTFNNAYYGIFDGRSPGGNSYSNNSFAKTIFMSIAVGQGSNLLTLDRCQFSPPPSN